MSVLDTPTDPFGKYIILLFWSNNLIISIFQLQDYHGHYDLLLHKLLHIEIFKRYPVRKANSHPFLGVNVKHRLVVGFGIISIFFISHEKRLSLYFLLSILKYLSRGLEILLCIRGGGKIYIYWLIMNGFFRSYSLLLFRDTLFELNFSLTTSSWLNNFLRR